MFPVKGSATSKGYGKEHRDEILSGTVENRKALPVENGGIKFIQAVPISRKSCAIKAGIRALGIHPYSHRSLVLLSYFVSVLL